MTKSESTPTVRKLLSLLTAASLVEVDNYGKLHILARMTERETVVDLRMLDGGVFRLTYDELDKAGCVGNTIALTYMGDSELKLKLFFAAGKLPMSDDRPQRPDTITVELNILVTLDLKGEAQETALSRLRGIPSRANREGFYTGDGDSEVVEWRANVGAV